MTKPEKSYRHKIDNGPEPMLKHVGEETPVWFGRGLMLIANPQWVEDYIMTIPEGEFRTMDDLRHALAKRGNADFACPLTSGIFARVVAEASFYEQENGLQVTAPWWRLVKSDGTMNEKFPGQGDLQAELLEKEGVKLISRGRSKKLKVNLHPEALPV